MQIITGINIFKIYSGKYHKCGYHLNNLPMLTYKMDNVEVKPKMKYIQLLTSDSHLLNLLCKFKGITLNKTDTNKCKIDFDDETIEFYRISDLIEEENNEEAIAVKKELLNFKKRSGHCHSMCMQYVNSFGEKMVTGYVNDIVKSIRTVHSWIETDTDVIDYTRNLVISKEDYYRLLNPEILNVITKEQLNNDVDMLNQMNFLGSKIYCLFRDEILTDIERSNIDLFSESNYEKKLK